MLIAQITDLHIRPKGKKAYGCADTAKMAADSFATLSNLKTKPDVLLLSGDLTDCGLIEEYQILHELVSQLDIPVYVIPGNHDRRENLKQVFSDHDYLSQSGSQYMNYAIDDFPVRLVGLDSVVPGQGYGLMDDERLEWLEQTLASDRSKPTIVFMHHPPFPTGIAHMDKINCRGGDDMATIISQHPNVERVLAGHHHRPIHVHWAATIGSVAPSVAHQVLLDLEENDYADAMIKMEPPAFNLHMWEPYTGVITHQVYIGDFPGPYKFNLDPDYPAYKASPVSL